MKEMMPDKPTNAASWWIPASDLFVTPTVWKDMSRIVDMWGNLDEYLYSSDPDVEAIKRDYYITRNIIEDSAQEYGERNRQIYQPSQA